jgi:hypothetical protein
MRSDQTLLFNAGLGVQVCQLGGLARRPAALLIHR